MKAFNSPTCPCCYQTTEYDLPMSKGLAIFETKIENSTKSKWTDFEARYSTYDEALKGHENAVLQVKKRFK